MAADIDEVDRELIFIEPIAVHGGVHGGGDDAAETADEDKVRGVEWFEGGEVVLAVRQCAINASDADEFSLNNDGGKSVRRSAPLRKYMAR